VQSDLACNSFARLHWTGSGAGAGLITGVGFGGGAASDSVSLISVGQFGQASVGSVMVPDPS